MKSFTCDEKNKVIYKESYGILQSSNYSNYSNETNEGRFILSPPEGYGIMFYLLDLSFIQQNDGGDEFVIYEMNLFELKKY